MMEKPTNQQYSLKMKNCFLPSGIAVTGSKIIVSCSPNMIIYTDENGDDKPDKKEIFLTGFGGKRS
jgi:hypothetical protein